VSEVSVSSKLLHNSSGVSTQSGAHGKI